MGTQNQSLAKFGGARRDRTADLLHAMQALSQLSYSPTRGPGHYGTLPALSSPNASLLAGLSLCLVATNASPGMRLEPKPNRPKGNLGPVIYPIMAVCHNSRLSSCGNDNLLRSRSGHCDRLSPDEIP